jgi:hypothetical protein
MATRSDEYNSLRNEILEHQKKRTTVLTLALTASAALFATSAELQNPYLPLFALPLLFFARIEIARIHYGIQRIASYIRVVLEEEGKNPELRWETASYDIRLESVKNQKQVWAASTLYPVNGILYTSGWVASLLALLLPWLQKTQSLSPPLWPLPVSVYISVVATATWLWLWHSYSGKVRELERMEVDKREAEFWRQWEADRKSKPKEQGPG